MEFLRDAEAVFINSFAPKPARTFVVNTNAPLHSVNSNVLPSSGVCTFPPGSTFPDRFILWRAIGQKLYLEERSICRTVVDNTLCLDFSRTPILPGTSIALFEQGILCVVVPTQSTVHRFFARLVFDPTEVTSKEVSSIFTQLIEKDFLVDDHDYYQLTTNGHAFRASVIHQSSLTRISYCMMEGQMVVVTMHSSKYDRVDEAIFREYGLMKRLLGEASGGVSDVYGLTNVKSALSEPEDVFYAIYRDGTLRAWNSGTQRVRSVDVCKFDGGIEYEEENLTSFSVKACYIDLLAVVIVAVSTTKNTKFHFVSDRLNKLTHLFTIVAENAETLMDFGILHKNHGERSLWALWNSGSNANEYILAHIAVDMPPKPVGTWRNVNPYLVHNAVSAAMNSSELRDLIFAVDSHPFDIVLRSVQIACKGSPCECVYGDWSSLTSHVDAYIRSTEFYENYVHRGGGTTKSLCSDAHEDAEQRFFYSLCCTCDQLERAARGPLGLFLLDIEGASLAGVVQQDRFSVVVTGEPELIKEFESYTVGVMENILSVATARALAKDDDGFGIDEYEMIKGPAHDCTTMRAQTVVKKWASVIDCFLETISSSFIPQDSPLEYLFGGSFTCGLIASKLQHVVRHRLDIARKLLSVIQLYAEDSKRYEYPIFDFPDLEAKFDDIINLYQLFDAQLGLRLPRDSAQISLCSWVMSGDGVDWICKAARVGVHGENTKLPRFNYFVDVVVNASLNVLSPRSPHALLARILATHEKYFTLMSLCSSYTDDVSNELRPVVTFYNAIAYSGIGKPLKAMTAFNSAARGVVDSNDGLLFALSPIGQPLQEISLGDYYVEALRYLHEHRHSEEVIEMARSAISALPPGHECTSRIYVTLFNHLVNQGNWCDALQSIIQNADVEIKRMTLREMISRMLHAQDWKSIVELMYGKLEEDVENILLTAARTQEATTTPHLFKLMFSFYMKRNDFESAARAQYEYAFVLRTQTEQTPEILRRRRDALAVASTLLDLLPKVDRFLSFPHELVEECDSEGSTEDTSMNVTEEMIDAAMGDVIADELDMVPPPCGSVRRRMFILSADKLREEWVVANARVSLLVTGKVPPCEPNEIVEGLIDIKEYDIAFDVCRHCDVSVCDLLYAVTRESIMIDADPHDVLPSWVQVNQRHSEKQTSRNHWSIVRGMVAYAQRLWPDDSRPLRAVTRAFLSYDLPVPCWLDADYSLRDIGGYLRCLIEYGAVSHGLKVAAHCVDDETRKVNSIDCRVWLPLAAINELLNLKTKETETSHLSILTEKLRTHFTRVEGFETAAKFSH